MQSRIDTIIALRAEGKSYQKISDELGVDKGYAWRVCNKATYPRKRLEDAVSIAPKREAYKGEHESLATGAISEALTAVKLTALGFDVWKPFLDRHRSDLGVFVNGRLVRIQVKTASYDEKTKRFRVPLKTKRKGEHLRYPVGAFDFFVIKCVRLDEFYVLPFDIGEKVSYANLYPHREKLMDAGYDFEGYRNNFELLRG